MAERHRNSIKGKKQREHDRAAEQALAQGDHTAAKRHKRYADAWAQFGTSPRA